VSVPLFITVSHSPLLRVVNAGWRDPLDTSWSAKSGGRWNTMGTFEALHTFGSRRGARAFAWEKMRLLGVVPEDLLSEAHPQLVELYWNGTVVDVATKDGVRAVGFDEDYPTDVDWSETQPLGAVWHASGHEGVQCRSATLERIGESSWAGAPLDWSEIVLFSSNTKQAPRLSRRVPGMAFLY